MIELLNGVNLTCAAIAAVFFLRFWRDSGDRFFASFALAFGLLGVHWLGLALTAPDYEFRPLLYGIRLVAFVLILGAIVQKNRVPASEGAG
jgi:hypothetical protein